MAKRRRREIVVRFREDRQRWEVDHCDVRGKRHRPLFDTEQEAHTHAGKVADELRSGLSEIDDPDLTCGAYIDRWLARAEAEGEIERKTLGSYRQLLTAHIKPTLGAYRLRELRPKHVRTLLAAKRAEQYGTGNARRPYSKNTIRLIKAALSTVLTDAIDDDYLTVNPAYNTGRKKRRAEKITDAERIAKIRPLTRDELAALLSTKAPDWRVALWALMGKGGLRPGEAAAVRVEDIDFRRGVVRVERATTDGGRVETIKSTKTACVRDVEMSRDLAAILRRHITRLRAEALKAGSGEVTWLFPVASGRLLDRYAIRDSFRRALKAAKIGHHRPYDLRHTFASLLLAEGAPLPYVAAQLGHSKPTTTLRYYAHVMPQHGRRWVNVLDGGVGRPKGVTEPQRGTNDETASSNA
jgi:integrase